MNNLAARRIPRSVDGSQPPLSKLLSGRQVTVITEERYLANESKLFTHTASLVGAVPQVLSYSQFLSAPQEPSPDILLMRLSRLFVFSFLKIRASLEGFRGTNPRSVVIASVIDPNALDALSSRTDLVNHLDPGALREDVELLRKGAAILRSMQ
jgi:hypothetical protein